MIYQVQNNHQNKPFLKPCYSLFNQLLVPTNVVMVFLIIPFTILTRTLVRPTVVKADGSFHDPTLLSGVTTASFQLIGDSPWPSDVSYIVFHKVAICCANCLSVYGCS